MELSLSEAARLLGKSDRQMRYLLNGGQISARKNRGRWVIRREDLPLSEGQERAARRKIERAAHLAEEVLGSDLRGAKKGFSVREMRAYREGAPLYRDLVAAAGVEHPGVKFLESNYCARSSEQTPSDDRPGVVG